MIVHVFSRSKRSWPTWIYAMPVAALLLLPGFGLPAESLSPGVVYEIEVKDHSQSPPTTDIAEVSVEKNLMKTKIIPAKGGTARDEVIVRGDRREMIVVNHEEQFYTVLDEKTAQQLRQQLGEAMKMAEGMQIPQAALDAMPEEERKKLEDMMRKEKGGMGMAAAGEISESFIKTNERGTKHGYPCVRYDVMRGEEKVRELWVTDWSNVEGGDELQEGLKAVADIVTEMMESFSDMGSGPDGLFPSRSVRGLMPGGGEIDGVPVVTREFEGGELSGESFLRSATRRALDPDEFEPPAGYKRRSML